MSPQPGLVSQGWCPDEGYAFRVLQYACVRVCVRECVRPAHAPCTQFHLLTPLLSNSHLPYTPYTPHPPFGLEFTTLHP